MVQKQGAGPTQVARVAHMEASALSLCRGYNIGIRLVDEFLAKAKITKCSNFRESLEAVAKHALPMFLNVSAQLANLSSDGTECSLVRPGHKASDQSWLSNVNRL